MSIPKSISLFLASVLVAIPTALTGIHLAKPKPLVHMNDELIELDEREEIAEPEEIKPKPKPESKPDSSPSTPVLPTMPIGSQSQSEGSQDGEQQQILPEGGDQEEVEEEGSNPPEEQQTTEEKADEEPPANDEEETQDNESDNNEQEKDQDKKEPKEQELKDFLIQLIPLLIESSNKYKSGDPSLFDTYSVMSGLADLKSTLEPYKQLQEKAKAAETKQENK